MAVSGKSILSRAELQVQRPWGRRVRDCLRNGKGATHCGWSRASKEQVRSDRYTWAGRAIVGHDALCLAQSKWNESHCKVLSGLGT